MLTSEHIDAYLNRLGFDAPVPTNAAGLAELHEAHLRAIPFENLSVHLADRITLEPQALVAKILAGRGGFCYELNGAFATLLTALGFPTELLEARVYDGSELGIRFDHLALRVDAGSPFLVDVGFGENFLRPLRLDQTGPQIDAFGTFTISSTSDGWRDLLADGVPQYSFSVTPSRLEDFADGVRFHATSAASPFARNTICSIVTRRGRVTLKDRTLITTADGQRSERKLDDEELLEAYWTHFGIELDQVPRVRTPA